MTRQPYMRPAMIAQRRRAIAWIMAHRPRRVCLALVLVRDTPQAIAAAWRNGQITTYAAQLAIIGLISGPVGAMFALYF